MLNSRWFRPTIFFVQLTNPLHFTLSQSNKFEKQTTKTKFFVLQIKLLSQSLTSSINSFNDSTYSVDPFITDEGLAAEIDKCYFHVKEVDFLGYVLSDKGVSISDDTVQTIRDWKPPSSQHDVQVFMGFANSYRRFIRNFSGVSRPITDTLKGDKRQFVWTEACDRAFQFLK